MKWTELQMKGKFIFQTPEKDELLCELKLLSKCMKFPHSTIALVLRWDIDNGE